MVSSSSLLSWCCTANYDVCNLNNTDDSKTKPLHKDCLDLSNTSSNDISAIAYGIETAYDQLFYLVGAKTYF